MSEIFEQFLTVLPPAWSVCLLLNPSLSAVEEAEWSCSVCKKKKKKVSFSFYGSSFWDQNLCYFSTHRMEAGGAVKVFPRTFQSWADFHRSPADQYGGTEVKISGARIPSFLPPSSLLPPFLPSFPSFVGGGGRRRRVGKGGMQLQTSVDPSNFSTLSWGAEAL